MQYPPHEHCSPLPDASKCKVHPEPRNVHAHLAQEIPHMYASTLHLMERKNEEKPYVGTGASASHSTITT